MGAPQKRLPGQSNAEYDGRRDPNASYIGTQAVVEGGDPSWVMRLSGALLSWRDRRRAQRHPSS